MTRKLQPADAQDVENVRKAMDLLRQARDILKVSGCLQAAQKTRLAITSAGGAVRHVERRAFETKYDTRRGDVLSELPFEQVESDTYTYERRDGYCCGEKHL